MKPNLVSGNNVGISCLCRALSYQNPRKKIYFKAQRCRACLLSQHLGGGRGGRGNQISKSDDILVYMASSRTAQAVWRDLDPHQYFFLITCIYCLCVYTCASACAHRAENNLRNQLFFPSPRWELNSGQQAGQQVLLSTDSYPSPYLCL